MLYPEETDMTIGSPFDWTSINDHKEILKVLESDFECMDNASPTELCIAEEFKFEGCDIYVPHRYDKETIKRRVNRFRESMSEKIVFVVKTHYCGEYIFPGYNRRILSPSMTIEDARLLERCLKEYKKDDNFTLLVVNESTTPRERVVENNIVMEWLNGDVLKEGFICCCGYQGLMTYAGQWGEIIERLDAAK